MAFLIFHCSDHRVGSRAFLRNVHALDAPVRGITNLGERPVFFQLFPCRKTSKGVTVLADLSIVLYDSGKESQRHIVRLTAITLP